MSEEVVVHAPPANRRALREAEERQRAIPVYRALVRAHEQQPPVALTWAELRDASGAFTIDEVIGAVTWMRGHGVAILVAPGLTSGEPALVGLSERLPEVLEPQGV